MRWKEDRSSEQRGEGVKYLLGKKKVWIGQENVLSILTGCCGPLIFRAIFQVKRVSIIVFFSRHFQQLRYRCRVVEVISYTQDLSFQFTGTRKLRVYARKIMPMLYKEESERWTCRWGIGDRINCHKILFSVKELSG